MKYNERYFEHVAECKCDINQIKTTVESVVKRQAPYECDKDGNKLFYVDSFGYRGQIPGETDECHEAMSKRRYEANKLPEGCTCCYSMNGVLDWVEDDCPIHAIHEE